MSISRLPVAAGPRVHARTPLAWLGVLAALYLLVPLVAFVIRLAGSGDRGFATDGLWSALVVSVESASIATVLILLFGVPLAWWLARSRGWAASVIGVLVQLPLALPPVMSGIVLIYVVGPYTWLGERFGGALTDSTTGVVIAQTFVASPFLIVAARSAFAEVPPALEDLAATLGLGPTARFLRVDLPVAAGGIRAGTLLTWLRALGEYGATVLLAYHPYSLPVFTNVQFSSSGLPDTQAPTALALALAVVVLLAAQVRTRLRRRPVAVLPSPVPPGVLQPTVVDADLSVTVGTFSLRMAHRATASRIAVLGPSGAGKSMTLRALAGLVPVGAGTVRYGSQDVTSLPVEHRGVGYVPQDLGLFPGRTVWQQVTFGRDSDPGLAAWWVGTLGLTGLVDRYPGELSGGQRQRVSLAQALSHSPRLVLLDEPFSALDAPVRDELRRSLRRLQRETGLSTVLVTHDPVEAALLADEVVVIDGGRVLQAGPTTEVYSRPVSARVARLVGMRNINRGRLVDGRLESGGTVLASGLVGAGGEVLWSIRPERILLSPAGEGVTAVVEDLADVGSGTVATLSVGGCELQVWAPGPLHAVVGGGVGVELPPADLSVWTGDSGEMSD